MSNSHKIYCFTQRLLDCFDRFFNARKISAVREFVITRISPKVNCRPAVRLNAAKRMAYYLNAGSIEEELRIFSDSAGYAIDPLSFQVTEVIGLSHTGLILKIISNTLKAVFEK